MSQVSPRHGYARGHINMNSTYFISFKALLANTGTPVPGRAPTPPPPGSLRIPFSGCMNSGGHRDAPSRFPFRGGFVPANVSLGLSCKGAISPKGTPFPGQPTPSGRWRREVKAQPCQPTQDNSDRPRVTQSSQWG